MENICYAELKGRPLGPDDTAKQNRESMKALKIIPVRLGSGSMITVLQEHSRAGSVDGTRPTDVADVSCRRDTRYSIQDKVVTER